MFADLGDFIRVWIMMSLLLLAPILERAPGLPLVRADLEASASENQECLPLRAESAAIPKGASFEFFDRDLAYAGGYGLRPLAGLPNKANLDLLDHELAHAGGYGFRSAAGVVRGLEFDFLDHELRYAGGYGLCAGALAAR